MSESRDTARGKSFLFRTKESTLPGRSVFLRSPARTKRGTFNLGRSGGHGAIYVNAITRNGTERKDTADRYATLRSALRERRYSIIARACRDYSKEPRDVHAAPPLGSLFTRPSSFLPLFVQRALRSLPKSPKT